jgi:solute carrier family 34 (sodium-dependent phosphate cotransporter)
MESRVEPPSAPSNAPNTTPQKLLSGAAWALRLLLALFLFVGSLQLMKTGAASLDLFKAGGYLVRNAGSTLGLGWLGALFVLSGSPIAATALTLVAADNITETQGFTMLTGSRLGAAFVVLVTAVIFALRADEGEKMKPVSTAVMALSTTALIYIPSALLGFALLNWGPFSHLNIEFPGQFADLLDVIYGGILDRVDTWPAFLVFLGGLGVLLLSFKALDSVMPQLDGEEGIGDRRLAWLRKKWTMFALGCAVALVTMSVSVALTVLVPLVAKGYAKREDIIPYIMGANITTLGDTLLAAFALHSPAAVRIVLAGIISTTILSVLLLAFLYPQIKRSIWKFQRMMVRSRSRLAIFTAGLFAVPIAIITISGWAG